MQFETRLRGNAYICFAQLNENHEVSIQISDLNANPVELNLTDEEVGHLTEELDMALYAASKGIDY